jgi:diphthamide biosynthesis protein 4
MVVLIDHYKVLGVPPTASFDEIKKAFRQAALLHHPDKTGTDNDTDAFLKIQKAWDILSNPEARAVYDLQRAAAEARAEVHITDTISVDNMESGRTEDGETMVSWPCRCGGAYAVLEEELFSHQDILPTDDSGGGGVINQNNYSNTNSSEVVVPCSTCSLHILVVLHNKNNVISP